MSETCRGGGAGLLRAQLRFSLPGTVEFAEFLNEEAKNIIGDRGKDGKHKASLTEPRANSPEGTVFTADLGALVLTRDQVEHAQMKFEDWDTDRSGTLSSSELKKVSKELGLKCSKTEFTKGIKKAFKKWDSDGDGSLTFNEFLPVYNFLYTSEMNFDEV